MYNKVTFAGYLTRDPETRYTPKGVAVATFSVAANRKWKSEDGEQREEVTFADFTAFGRTAETIGQYFSKGKPILVEARLRNENWEDKQTGQKRSKLSCIVESFVFLPDGRERAEHAPPPPQPRQSRAPGDAARRSADAAAAQDRQSAGLPEDDEDDVPF